MALTAAGLRDEAAAARTSGRATQQRADGSWAVSTSATRSPTRTPTPTSAPTSATGVWHHWLVTGDRRLRRADVADASSAAIDAVLRCSAPTGRSRGPSAATGVPPPRPSLTGNASIHLSLRCAIALAERRRRAAPDWELAAGPAAARRSTTTPSLSRRQADPLDGLVLPGARRRAHRRRPPHARLDARWDEFVVAGLGMPLRHDQPWVTGARDRASCVLALDALGRRDDATRAARRDAAPARPRRLLLDRAGLRRRRRAGRSSAPRGPAATVVLAADALSRTTPAAGCSAATGCPSSRPAPDVTCPSSTVDPLPLPSSPPGLLADVPGFMPADEGLALHAAAVRTSPGPSRRTTGRAARSRSAPTAGSRRSTSATRRPRRGAAVVTIDHHRGSEEHQVGWEYHDPIARRPRDRAARHAARTCAARCGSPAWRTSSRRSSAARPPSPAWWRTPIDLLFIDGGHTDEAAQADFRGWAPHVRARRRAASSTTSSPTPPTAGRRPTASTVAALDGGEFVERSVTGSLRVLERRRESRRVPATG